jgi:hypothetical protein
LRDELWTFASEGGEGFILVGLKVSERVLSMKWVPSVRTCVTNVFNVILVALSGVVDVPLLTVGMLFVCAAARVG